MSLPEQAPDVVAQAPRSVGVDPRETRNGVVAALSAYLLWGVLPILFHLVEEAGAVLIVAERTLWSFLLLAVIIAARGGFGEVRKLLGDGRRMGVVALSSILLAGNWLLYVWAIATGQVLEASFGYFINPLVNVAIGVIFLGERQNRLQGIAIGIATVAILIQALGLGNFPFVALGLALTFGFYGFLRKTVQTGPVTGLFAETMMVAPFALAFIAYDVTTRGMGVHSDPGMLVLLLLTGPATAIPLLLFAYGVRRLRLTTIGMFQYLSPSIQFVLAITLFGEELNGLRLVSFALIWLSLAVFSWDSFRQRRRVVA
ncbi:chloramphenicol-sensitive protein RarD [Devosia lucknowensis]|uniref:Chloramphenicol-sensitive protein RarD n=1 Tax=Devosia lucknowensis TaxID=1096929 RepID=A0A1Y6F5B3_9HYPH|nr:EamA family transporter RarD [Devosia lucknowensis]SMQ70055.1 chloramphenicol-sensitive protein RarD [Devosia lucknowensis]